MTVRDRYLAKLSGPLLDRFDLRVTVLRPKPESFFEKSSTEPSFAVAERVAQVHGRALQRGVRCNADLASATLDQWAELSPDASAILGRHMRVGRLTGRGLDRVRRVARTLADLEDPAAPLDSPLQEHHVCAALELRPPQHLLEVA
jgi:magnesium chelatase family protein